MFWKRYKTFLVLATIIILLVIFSLYFRQIKRIELEHEIEKVEVLNIRIGTGTSKGKLGTAIFGEIINNGDHTIKIATINVEFIDESGEIAKVHKFFPVNNYSFSDSLPLKPGQSKDFGFPIDDIVPENWGGTISSKLIDLKFK